MGVCSSSSSSNPQCNSPDDTNRPISSERYDIVINFCSAEGLPKMDIIGQGDPYFIANIDNKINYTSAIISDTKSPKWDHEEWIVRNIPADAKLSIFIYDKDDIRIDDEYVGAVKIDDIVNYKALEEGHVILNSSNKSCGRFHLLINADKVSDDTKDLPSYTYDGPCRYFRHNDFLFGLLTVFKSDTYYSTWKVQMRRIFYFFPDDKLQRWNRSNERAQSLFGDGALSTVMKDSLKLVHRKLYRRNLRNTEEGQLNDSNDLWNELFRRKGKEPIKPCIYTYIIDDYTWRFSEAGNSDVADYISKHALLANAAEKVRYAGQFHPRPKFGWSQRDKEWELVLDNASGTYSPSADLLTNLKELFLFNFPGLNVVTYDHKDQSLEASIQELQIAAKS